jgi:hypothetical protein
MLNSILQIDSRQVIQVKTTAMRELTGLPVVFTADYDYNGHSYMLFIDKKTGRCFVEDNETAVRSEITLAADGKTAVFVKLKETV